MINKNLLIFIPSIEGYGVEKNLFIISNYLVRKFRHVCLITYDKKYAKKFDKKIKIIYPKYLKLKAVTKGRLGKYLICSLLLFNFLFKNNKYTVLSFQANVFAIIISKIFNSKVIIRLNSSLSGINSTILKKLLNFFYKFSNKIIVNSLEFKKEIVKNFKIKSECIYNPLNIEEIFYKSKKKIKTFNNNSKLKIINIGRLVPQKNHILLLKVINKIKDQYNFKIELIIIGEGNLKNSLLKYIKNNRLGKIVKILSFKSNPYPYIKSADLFILTSLYEGLPNVLLEAKSLNTYIISSNCSTGPVEIIEDSKTGLLFKNNSEHDLVKKINLYIKNKKKYNKSKINNKNKLKKFSFKRNLNLYEQILK